MRKILSILIVALLAASVVFGAGSAETPADQSAAEGKTVVTIWTMDRHDAPFWQERIDAYNASNPHNIYVDYQIYTDNYWQAVDMAFQTGETPDVFRYDPALDKYLFQDKFIDLLPFMTEDQIELTKAGWYDGTNLIDGKLYCIFTGSGAARLFYNTAIFERLGLEPPRTLDEMVEAARTITEELSSEGIYGFACNLKSAENGLKRSLEPQVEIGTGLRYGYNFGTGYYDFSGYIPYIEAWKELMEVAFPGCESLDIDPLRSQFAAGKIGMYFSYAQSDPGVFDNQFPMAEGQDWGCVYIPVIEKKGKQYAGGTPAYYICKDSDNIEAAWQAYSDLFLNFDNLVARFEQNLGLSNLPAVIAAADLPVKFQENPEIMINPDWDTVYPKTPQEMYPQDFIVEGLDMYTTFAAIIAGQLDVEEGIADLTERFNAAYDAMLESGVVTERITNQAFAPEA